MFHHFLLSLCSLCQWSWPMLLNQNILPLSPFCWDIWSGLPPVSLCPWYCPVCFRLASKRRCSAPENTYFYKDNLLFLSRPYEIRSLNVSLFVQCNLTRVLQHPRVSAILVVRALFRSHSDLISGKNGHLLYLRNSLAIGGYRKSGVVSLSRSGYFEVPFSVWDTCSLTGVR